jgi:hypothetical protein
MLETGSIAELATPAMMQPQIVVLFFMAFPSTIPYFSDITECYCDRSIASLPIAPDAREINSEFERGDN